MWKKEWLGQEIKIYIYLDKIYLQIWLRPKITTLLNIFLLDVNFDKSTIGLDFHFISSMLVNFLEN